MSHTADLQLAMCVSALIAFKETQALRRRQFLPGFLVRYSFFKLCSVVKGRMPQHLGQQNTAAQE